MDGTGWRHAAHSPWRSSLRGLGGDRQHMALGARIWGVGGGGRGSAWMKPGGNTKVRGTHTPARRHPASRPPAHL
eukprot:365718-Chlamydomonas_euryale.AAC.4